MACPATGCPAETLVTGYSAAALVTGLAFGMPAAICIRLLNSLAFGMPPALVRGYPVALNKADLFSK